MYITQKKRLTSKVVFFLVLAKMKPMTKINHENCLERSLHMSSTKNNTQVWLVVSAFCFKKSLRVLQYIKGDLVSLKEEVFEACF